MIVLHLLVSIMAPVMMKLMDTCVTVLLDTQTKTVRSMWMSASRFLVTMVVCVVMVSMGTRVVANKGLLAQTVQQTFKNVTLILVVMVVHAQMTLAK
jgi:hypothetical protein